MTEAGLKVMKPIKKKSVVGAHRTGKKDFCA